MVLRSLVRVDFHGKLRSKDASWCQIPLSQKNCVSVLAVSQLVLPRCSTMPLVTKCGPGLPFLPYSDNLYSTTISNLLGFKAYRNVLPCCALVYMTMVIIMFCVTIIYPSSMKKWCMLSRCQFLCCRSKCNETYWQKATNGMCSPHKTCSTTQ